MLGLMKSARTWFCLVALLAETAVPCFGQGAGSAQQFLELWGKAWEAHDVDAIVRLHADDCVTVNRFGVEASGKDEIRRAMAWLHNGPFHNAHFGAPKLLDQRRLTPGLMVLHASWKNPSGRADPPEDTLVVTLILKDFGPEGWLAEEVDTHTVDPLAPGSVPESGATKP